MPLKQMSFRLKPLYFKKDGPVVHEVHPVFVVILSTFANMLCGSNDDTMPSFNLFCVQVVVLSNYRVISWKYIIKCMKNSKWSQKGLKFQYVALNVACWMQKRSWVEMSLEKWNAFEIDARLKASYFEIDSPVCTRSASSFSRNPLNFCTHVMWVKWWYHAKFQPFWVQVVALSNFKVI